MFTWILIGGVVLFFFAGRQVSTQQLSNVSHTFGAGHLENIQNFKISDFAAKVNIMKSKSNEISIKAENIIESELKCSISADKTLVISYKPKWFGFFSLPNFNKTAVINIYIPEDKAFDNFDIRQGIGNIDAEYIKTNRFNIAGGVGNSTVTGDMENIDIRGGVGIVTVNGTINGDLRVDGGVGNINLDLDGNTTDLKIAGGVGCVKVASVIAGNVKVNGGVGDVKLDLKGNIYDYNLNIKTGVGTVRINGEKASSYQKNTSAPYTLKVDGGVGNIDLKTI